MEEAEQVQADRTIGAVFSIVRGAWAVFWLVVGAAFVVTGLVFLVGTFTGQGDHDWWAGPVIVLVGPWLGGYFSLYRVWKSQHPS
jgi:hypothetical protein